MDIESTDFDLHDLVDATVKIVTPTALGRGVEVITDIASDVPSGVVGDPTRVRQVLTNLLGNAVKFTQSGEIVVAVRSSIDGDAIRFSVADTGIGMTSETLAGIFEPFRQAASCTPGGSGGRGLGLPLSRALGQRMGGPPAVAGNRG